jgi:hypothetical protein
MKAVRDLGMGNEVVKEEWAECTSVVLDYIGTRMSQLFFKEEPVDITPSATDEDVNALKEVLIGACDYFSDKLSSRDELRQMPKLEALIKMVDSNQHIYRIFVENALVPQHGSSSCSNILCRMQ